MRENVASELALHLCSIYAQLKEDNVRLELESIRLKMIVRLVEFPFE